MSSDTFFSCAKVGSIYTADMKTHNVPQSRRQKLQGSYLKQIAQIGPFVEGTLSEYKRAGRKASSWHLTFKVEGKTKTVYVPVDMVEEVRQWKKNIGACGMTMTVEDIRRDVAQDRGFYETSGGGVTISGGDPQAQMEFAVALLEALRADGIHVCVETSGFGRQEDLLRLARLTDLLLWDVKGTDEEEHIRHTGVPLQPILDNLRAVDATGAKTVLRCPLVANMNLTPQHLGGIAAIACSAAPEHVERRRCFGVHEEQRGVDLPWHC